VNIQAEGGEVELTRSKDKLDMMSALSALLASMLVPLVDVKTEWLG
jgi:hypothetical protein